MIQTTILIKWKFVVEFEDEETNEISGMIGQADTAKNARGSLSMTCSTIALVGEPS